MRTLIGLAMLIAGLLMGAGAACGAEGGGSKLPAFPGAEGAGAVSKGGRGGKVIKVTTLKASGPGSFHAALRASGPRIIVFDVSGVIERARSKYNKVVAAGGNVTIAGQTAPGPGITLEGQLRFQGKFEDITVRHMRLRSTKEDAARFGGCNRVIADHVSFSWGGDETVDLGGTKNATMQWCTIEESALNWEGGDEPHNFGVLMSEGPLSLHHMLFAHHHDRAPSDYPRAHDVDSRNNVIYNFGTTLHSRSGNLMNNYGKYGWGAWFGFPRIYHPVGTYAAPALSWAVSRNKDHNYPTYVKGNYLDWAGGYYEPKARGARMRRPIGEKENPAAPVTTHVAEEAYEEVMAHVGALPRDEITARCVYEVRTRTGLWGRQYPRGDWRARLAGGKPRPDADNDGMPDEWEKAHKLNPNDPKDNNKTVPAGASPGDRHKGYTYIEYYINELADIRLAERLTADRLRTSDGKEVPKPEWSALPKTIPELVADIDMQNDKIKKTNTRASYMAIRTLRMAGPKAAPAAAPLVKVLNTDDNRKTLFAAWALGAIAAHADEKIVVPALIKRLEHPYPVSNSKWKFNPAGFIAWALGCYGPRAKDAVPALAKALHGKDIWARQPAAWALSQIGKDAAPATDALIKSLGAVGGGGWGSKRDCRVHAAHALANIGKPAVPALIRAVGSAGGKSGARAGAAMALAMIGPDAKDAATALIAALKSPDHYLKSKAADALARVAPGGAGVVPALVAELGTADYGARNNVAKALGTCGPAAKGAVDALKKTLTDKKKEIRYSAAKALGGIGKDAVPALAEVLGGPGDAWLRSKCAQALGFAGAGPGAAQAVPALQKALTDKSKLVRREAVWALGRIGPAAKLAAPGLEKLAKDEDFIVRVAAGKVLEAMKARK